MSLLTMEMQPNFPHEDLSDSNMLLLELMLQNKAMLESFHQAAESSSRLFRLGHQAIYASVYRAIDDLSSLPAYSVGISTYEIISSLIRTTDTFAQYDDDLVIEYFTDSETRYQGYEHVANEAREHFVSNLPRTSAVISAATARFYPGREDQILTGAALTYVAECDIADQSN